MADPITSSLTPTSVVTSLGEGLAARETSLNTKLAAAHKDMNQGELLKLQAEFQRYLQGFSMTSALVKSVHDTQSDIIRKF